MAAQVEAPAAKVLGESLGQRFEDGGTEPGGMNEEEVGASAPEVGDGDGQAVGGDAVETILACRSRCRGPPGRR